MNQQERRRFFQAFSVLFALTMTAQLLLTPVAFAQTDQGRITGTVRDQAKAVIGGATVTITNERTGEQRSAVSAEQGQYVFANLKPSTYTLRANASGFGDSEITGIQLLVGQTLTSDIEVKPAGTRETVDITATDVGLDTSSARIGANVNAREVQELPFNGRQLSQLYLQAPGSLNSGSGTFGDIRFSGRAVEQNAGVPDLVAPRAHPGARCHV